MARSDIEWELMYREYIKRVPKSIAKSDPPIKTRIEEITSEVEEESGTEEQDV